MPQVDLETLVSVCGGSAASDRKISCETLAADNPPPPSTHPDSPPQSFYLPKDAEQDWLHENAIIERKDSAKANSNPNPNQNPHRLSFAFKSKASILGLPKPQKRTFVETKKKCKPVSARLFPKRSGSRGKSDGLVEPGSPKVSCMGRVRSKKDKRRKAQESQRKCDPARSGNRKNPGFLSGLRSMFRAGCSGGSATETGAACVESPMVERESRDGKYGVRAELPPREVDVPRRSVAETAGEVPGLGGMKRFASGRKSDSWVDADMVRS